MVPFQIIAICFLVMIIGNHSSLAMRHIFGAQAPKFFTKITKANSTESEVTNEKSNEIKQQDLAWVLLEIMLKLKKQREDAKR